MLVKLFCAVNYSLFHLKFSRHKEIPQAAQHMAREHKEADASKVCSYKVVICVQSILAQACLARPVTTTEHH